VKKNFRNAAIYTSLNFKKVQKIASQIYEVLDNLDVSVHLTESLESLSKKKSLSDKSIVKKSDLLISIGGDGSLLSSARRYGFSGLPLLGINLGNLGFLTDILPEDLTSSLIEVIKGKYLKDKRFFLEASVNNSPKSDIALNEIVIHSGSIAQLMEYEVFVDETFVYRQRADGLIVNTPTGSTAYSLSGGGPIVHPEVKAITLMPMFPHSLSASPLLVKEESNITIKIISGNKSMLSLDSHNSIPLKRGDIIDVSKSKKPLILIHPNDHNFFSACRNKLGWSERLSKS
jgi:NAD+ kinase